MTTFDEDVSSALFDHGDRLGGTEARIWALTCIVRDLLSFHDSEDVAARIKHIRDLVTVDDGTDPSAHLIVQGACEVLDQLMPDAHPVPPPAPVRPKLALIQGGRSDG